MSRVTDLIKGAVELNLRYTSTLLHLSKDYLKDAGVVLTRDEAPAPAPAPAPGQPRPPLLLAGRRGDLANAAFAINNPGDKDISVHLLVQGELGDERVKLDPARFSLAAGGSTIVRIVVAIDDKLEAERDHHGSVVAPGLSSQGVPFIVRRLADAQPTDGGADPTGAAAPPKAAAPAARRAR
jgi:hypothetical protein